MKVGITIGLVAIATLLLVSAAKFLPEVRFVFSENAFINGVLKYQLFALVVALGISAITLTISPESRKILRLGNLEVLASKEKWLAIDGQSTWRKNGLQFLFFISLATGIFMFLGVKYSNSLNNFQIAFLPLILLISLTNSLSEELIYRFTVIGNLQPTTLKMTMLLISAIMFGLPHFWGFPSGIIGVIMSGVLGYILAKSVTETQGIGLAWGIHFVQDVIIFTGIFMMNVR